VCKKCKKENCKGIIRKHIRGKGNNLNMLCIKESNIAAVSHNHMTVSFKPADVNSIVPRIF
jgi:hypothetical protein